jgi:hypothetical protein
MPGESGVALACAAAELGGRHDRRRGPDPHRRARRGGAVTLLPGSRAAARALASDLGSLRGGTACPAGGRVARRLRCFSRRG